MAYEEYGQNQSKMKISELKSVQSILMLLDEGYQTFSNIVFIKRSSKLPVWAMKQWEKILICIKAPDQIYRTLNPAIFIFRWCVFRFSFIGNGRVNSIEWEHNRIWNRWMWESGKAHTEKGCPIIFFCFGVHKPVNEKVSINADVDSFCLFLFLLLSLSLSLLLNF